MSIIRSSLPIRSTDTLMADCWLATDNDNGYSQLLLLLLLLLLVVVAVVVFVLGLLFAMVIGGDSITSICWLLSSKNDSKTSLNTIVCSPKLIKPPIRSLSLALPR